MNILREKIKNKEKSHRKFDGILFLYDKTRHQSGCGCCQRDDDKRLIEVRQDNGNYRADDGSDHIAGGVENGGNGHGAEHRIGYVVEEAAEETGADLPAEQGEGQHADQIGDTRHDKDIDEDRHASASVSSFTGKSRAPRSAAAMALRMMAKPPETAVKIKWKSRLHTAAARTTASTPRCSRAGGRMMARNMP